MAGRENAFGLFDGTQEEKTENEDGLIVHDGLVTGGTERDLEECVIQISEQFCGILSMSELESYGPLKAVYDVLLTFGFEFPEIDLNA